MSESIVERAGEEDDGESVGTVSPFEQRNVHMGSEVSNGMEFETASVRETSFAGQSNIFTTPVPTLEKSMTLEISASGDKKDV